jgi:aspartate aminotransferase
MFDLAGPDSVNLGLGEPDLEPPAAAVEGMHRATLSRKNKYGPTAGIPELREAVAERSSAYGEVAAGNVMITPSGSTALFAIAQSFLDPGDEVLVPSPGFVVYGPHAALAGGRSREYRLTEGNFQPDADDIASLINDRTRMIVVNSPSNPTGGILDAAAKRALLDLAEDHGLHIVSDEVYEPFIYEGEHVSFLDRPDLATVVGGFSKMMAVTGWRLGYICASEERIEALTKMQYHICANPHMPSQYGVLAAMPGIEGYLERSRGIYRARRDLITRRIDGIDGLSMEPPRGAFYAFPRYDMDVKSEEIALEAARNGLICTPGSAFGTHGEGHLRFSYAAGEDKINAGMDILSDVIGRFRK